MIVVVAHIDPTTPPELSQIYAALRKAQPTVPLVLLSGHRCALRCLCSRAAHVCGTHDTRNTAHDTHDTQHGARHAT
jgi:hypothetical protein